MSLVMQPSKILSYSEIMKFLTNQIDVKIYSEQIFINKEIPQIVELIIRSLEKLNLLSQSILYQKIQIQNGYNVKIRNLNTSLKFLLLKDIFTNVFGVKISLKDFFNSSDNFLKNLFSYLIEFSEKISQLRVIFTNELQKEMQLKEQQTILEQETKVKDQELMNIQKKKEEEKPLTEKLNSIIKDIELKIKENQNTLESKQEDVQNKQKVFQKMEEEQRSLEQQIEMLEDDEVFKRNQVVNNFSEILKEKQNFEKTLQQLKERDEQIRYQLKKLDDNILIRERLNQNLSELVKLTNVVQKKKSLVQQTKKRLEGLQNELTQQQEQINENNKNIQHTNKIIEQFEKDYQILKQEKQNHSLAKLKENEDLENQWKGLKDKLNSIEKEIGHLSEQRNTMKLDLQNQEKQRDTLFQQYSTFQEKIFHELSLYMKKWDIKQINYQWISLSYQYHYLLSFFQSILKLILKIMENLFIEYFLNLQFNQVEYISSFHELIFLVQKLFEFIELQKYEVQHSDCDTAI